MKHAFAGAIIKNRGLEKRKKMWLGGNIEDDVTEYKDTTGEPGTNDKSDYSHSMEYMAQGGDVDPYAKLVNQRTAEENRQNMLARTQSLQTPKMAEGGEVASQDDKMKRALMHLHKMFEGGEAKSNSSVSGSGNEGAPSFEQRGGGHSNVIEMEAGKEMAHLARGGVAETNDLDDDVTEMDEDEEEDVNHYAEGGSVDKMAFAKYLKKRMMGY